VFNPFTLSSLLAAAAAAAEVAWRHNAKPR